MLQVKQITTGLMAVAGLLVLAACSAGLGDVDTEAKPQQGHITVSPTPATLGSSVTATVNPGGDVMVYLACYQNGEKVYHQMKRVSDDNTAHLTVGPSMIWTEGDAECIAEEGYFSKNNRWRVLATTTFLAIDPE